MRLVLMKTVRQSAALVSLLFFYYETAREIKDRRFVRSGPPYTTLQHFPLNVEIRTSHDSHPSDRHDVGRDLNQNVRSCLTSSVLTESTQSCTANTSVSPPPPSPFQRLVFTPRRHTWRKRRFHREHDLVPEQFHISASFLFLCCRYFEEKTKEIQCPLNAI